jgi:hypothetical protein
MQLLPYSALNQAFFFSPGRGAQLQKNECSSLVLTRMAAPLKFNIRSDSINPDTCLCHDLPQIACPTIRPGSAVQCDDLVQAHRRQHEAQGQGQGQQEEQGQGQQEGQGQHEGQGRHHDCQHHHHPQQVDTTAPGSLSE